MYFLAILLPPLAVLMAGKPMQSLLNVLLTACFWIPGMIHAFMVVAEYKADKRQERMLKGIAKIQR